jgi:hypothetical protein
LSYLVIYSKRGRRPHLKVIIDLTTLEKTGKFKGLGEVVKVYNGKKGLHLVVLYLVIDKWRISCYISKSRIIKIAKKGE